MVSVWFITLSTCLFWMANTETPNTTIHTNCTSTDIKQLGCPSTIRVKWWNYAPYIYNTTDEQNVDRTEGQMKEIVELMIRKCCGSCTKFSYGQPSLTAKELTQNIDVEESQLYFPVIGRKTDDRFLTYPFFSVVEPAGSIFFQKEKHAQEVSKVDKNGAFPHCRNIFF